MDEEFETVSTQLLKRTQAMLNKYRLLLLEESRVGWLSPPAPRPGDPGLPRLRGREAGGQITRGTVGNALPSPPGYSHPLPLGFFTCPSSPPQRVSPSAEMVMIDRMFIQEEKTTLALDKQLAKEKPGERGEDRRNGGVSPTPPTAAETRGGRGRGLAFSATRRRQSWPSCRGWAPGELSPPSPWPLTLRDLARREHSSTLRGRESRAAEPALG